VGRHADVKGLSEDFTLREKLNSEAFYAWLIHLQRSFLAQISEHEIAKSSSSATLARGIVGS
jgi:hypothetical protein